MAAVAALLTACTGTIGSPLSGEPSGGPSLPGTPGSLPAHCAPRADALYGHTPLRRLTNIEYAHAIQDLLGVRPSVDEFTPDEEVAGFRSNAHVAVTQGQVARFVTQATELAGEHTPTLLEAAGCGDDPESCMHALLADFGRRVYRRPLSAEEGASLRALHAAELARGGSQVDASRELIRALLASPHFLYHVEKGDGRGRLTAFELASRLAFLLWSSPPDDRLLDAAAAGELGESEGLQRQVDRMLAETSRVSRTVATFHRQWIGTVNIDGIALADQSRNAELYPTWTASLGAAYEDEAGDFAVRLLVEEGAPLGALFDAATTVASEEAASVYGARVANDGTVALDPGERRGVLMLGAFLANNAHGSTVSRVLRGKVIRERVLCGDIPSPPNDVDVSAEDAISGTAARLDPASICYDCHRLMDPIGQAFDGFDAMAAARELNELGEVAKGQGTVVDFPADPTLEGDFSSPLELTEKLATSDAVQACLVTQWMRFALHRREDVNDDDECAAARVAAHFLEGGRTLPELLRDVALSPAFASLQLEER